MIDEKDPLINEIKEDLPLYKRFVEKLFSFNSLLLFSYIVSVVAYQLFGKKVSEVMSNYTWTLSITQPLFMIPILALVQTIRRCLGTKFPKLDLKLILQLAGIAFLVFLSVLAIKYGIIFSALFISWSYDLMKVVEVIW